MMELSEAEKEIVLKNIKDIPAPIQTETRGLIPFEILLQL